MKPYRAKPVVLEACAACATFVPECLVPVGEAAVPMCWSCAHHVTEHDASLHDAPTGECECHPSEIYPADVLTVAS